MFSLGVMCLMVGYAMLYTGIANLMNSGTGPTLSESLGLPNRLAPPGADKPNTSVGQAPSSGRSASDHQVPGERNPAPRGS